MAANMWAQYTFLVDQGLIPATNMAIVPCLVALVYQGTFVQ